MLPLRVAVDCEDGVVSSSSAANARGAVLGNAVLWAAGCALTALLTCGYSLGAAVPLRTAAEALGVPSPLLPLVDATVPSTVSSTFALLRSSCAADAAVAALGVAMCVAPLVVLCGVALTAARRLYTTQVVVSTARSARCMSAHLIWMRRLSWDAPPVSGVVGDGEKASALRLERVATVVLLEYAVVWYLCVDVAVLIAAGLLGAVSTLGSLAACRGSAVAVAVMYVGQLVLCAAARPYTTLFSHVHTMLSLTLSAVSVWCQVWYLFASARDGADLDALGTLLAVSAVCEIVVSAASMLKSLLDAVEAVRACCRHVVVLMARVHDRGMVVEGADVGDLLAGWCDDAHFWRSDGSAAVDGGASLLGAAVVGVSTALEDMQQRHRGAAHDLLLHFRDAVLLE